MSTKLYSLDLETKAQIHKRKLDFPILSTYLSLLCLFRFLQFHFIINAAAPVGSLDTFCLELYHFHDDMSHADGSGIRDHYYYFIHIHDGAAVFRLILYLG